MILLAGGPVRKHRPSLLVLLEEIGGQLADLDTTEFLQSKSHFQQPSDSSKKGKRKAKNKVNRDVSPGKIYYSRNDRPYVAFEEALSSVPNSKAIIFYLPANLMLAEFLASSLSPEEAVFAWKETVTEVLNFFKRRRKSVLLVNADSALAFPDAFLEFCVNKFRFNGTDSIASLEIPVTPSAFYQMLALELIEQNPDIQKLQNELQACSIPFRPEKKAGVLDIGALASEYIGMKENLRRTKIQLEKLKQRDLRTTQIISELKKAENDLREQQTLALEHVADIQSHAENYYLELQNAKNQIQDQENKLAWRKAKTFRETTALKEDIDRYVKTIEALKSSASWRLSAPVRFVGRTLKRRSREKKLSAREIEMIKQSNLFDAEWYINAYSDVTGKRIDPFAHFIKFGGFEGRSPGPDFNAREYLINNPEVTIRGENPLIHYLKNAKQSSDPKQPDIRSVEQ